ncbi:galactokinase [Aquisediminimonas profunda]|uniref:galactokinase n=1 Tax=Aquisediminimonas profunda TaxID=1550733 RepID=UPI001C62FBE0|nr:galactokinase [Aquisediminimonas profunda]
MTIDPILIERTVSAFRRVHGRVPDLVSFAPGRVNLIGEHTDYNDGLAMPCALAVGTLVALGLRSDKRIEANALDLGNASASFGLGSYIPRQENGDWENHLRGIVAGMPRFDLPISGANIVLSGNIPQGSGLSSSASLGVALALGLSALSGEASPDRLALARVAQWSEHEFVGCACGLMDQLASVFGEQDQALLLDCRTLAVRHVPFPADATIMIVHSGVTRGLVDSAYNERRLQCAHAAKHYHLGALRDLDLDALRAGRGELDETVFRRARHVVTENARVLEAAQAMRESDLVSLGRAMFASHVSLRDDFEVSLPAIDTLVECLTEAIGINGGARMTGGGFGGCVVAVLPQNRVSTVQEALSAHWRQHGMEQQMVMVATPATGAHLVSGW